MALKFLSPSSVFRPDSGQAVAGAIVGVCLVSVIMGVLIFNFLGTKKIEQMQSGKSSILLLSGSVEAVALGHAQKVISLQGTKPLLTSPGESANSLPKLVAALNKLPDWAPGPWQWDQATTTPNQNFTLDPYEEETSLSSISPTKVGALVAGGKFGKLNIPVRIGATYADGTHVTIERTLSYYISNPATHTLANLEDDSLTITGINGPQAEWVNETIPRSTTKAQIAQAIYASFDSRGSVATASQMLNSDGVQYQTNYAGLTNVIVVDVATMPSVLTLTAGALNTVVVKGNPVDAVLAPKVFLTNCANIIIHGNNVTPLVLILPSSHSGQVKVLSPSVLPNTTTILPGQAAGLMNWRGVILWEGNSGTISPHAGWGEVWTTPLTFNGAMLIKGKSGASLSAVGMTVNLAADAAMVNATNTLAGSTRFRLVQATLE